MTKEDRKRQVLEFLDRTDLALPPKAIYVNMSRLENVTFSEKSVRRYMPEMEDSGLVEKLEEPSTYYRITDAGRDSLEDTD